MELKQFIKEALLNIVDGVEEANQENNRFKIVGVRHASGVDGSYADFDVYVKVEDKQDGKIEGSIKGAILSVVSSGIDSKLDLSSSQQNIHHLSFKVFISEKTSK